MCKVLLQNVSFLLEMGLPVVSMPIEAFDKISLDRNGFLQKCWEAESSLYHCRFLVNKKSIYPVAMEAVAMRDDVWAELLQLVS